MLHIRGHYLLPFVAWLLWFPSMQGQHFHAHMESRLQQSEKQWLVRSLLAQTPSLFQRPVDLPASLDTLEHLHWGSRSWRITPEERAEFLSLWCPDGKTERLQKLTSLLDLYGPLFKKSIEQKQLDPLYQWLPLLTSGVNQHFNDSAGRRGLWGLDYLHARRAGLQISEDWDDRCGGDYTSAAVASILSELDQLYHDDFKTLFTYLHGAPQVVQQKELNYATLPIDWQKEISFLCFSEHLIRNIRVTNQQHHYFDLMALYSPIRLKDTLNISVLRGVFQEDLDAIKGMNPTMTSQLLLPNVLKVPYFISANSANRFAVMEDSLYRYRETVAPGPSTAAQYHRVKRGESLGSIARKYGLTVNELQRLNKLKSTKIRQGQKLKISENQPNEETKSTSSEVVVDAPKPKVDKPNPKEEIYIVKSGDSLWKIARKYRGVSEEDIKKWNRCGDDLRPGQKLIIKVKR
jgi:membrane-bound lytic murein transglycosylase D